MRMRAFDLYVFAIVFALASTGFAENGKVGEGCHAFVTEAGEELFPRVIDLDEEIQLSHLEPGALKRMMTSGKGVISV